jgi:AcrR family transcriptional regulator
MATRRTDEAFLEELTHLLITTGVSSLTIGEMAQRIRCSRRRLYEIAETKEELFVHVCRKCAGSQSGKRHAAAKRAPTQRAPSRPICMPR